MKKTIVVTGGAGFVGTVLVPLLLQEGYRVRVIDLLREGGLGLLANFSNSDFSFVRGDVRKKEDLKKVLGDGVDFIVHLAAIVGYPSCRREPELSQDINVNGMRTMLEAAGKEIPVLFTSTIDAYGKLIKKICSETTPLNPLSDYGRQKSEAEAFITTRGNYVIYRFATGFGASPRMRLDTLPNDFTFRAVKEKSLIVYEKNFMRSFIHVRDMARAILYAIQHFDTMKNETYNVGNQSMNMTKEAICNILKKKVDYYLHFADIDKDVNKRDFFVSYEKINAAGFSTTITMDKGIDELIHACEVIDPPRYF